MRQRVGWSEVRDQPRFYDFNDLNEFNDFNVLNGFNLRWVDLSGRVPKYREEVTASARENKQVPDEMAVAQSLSREERHARRVRQPPSHEPR